MKNNIEQEKKKEQLKGQEIKSEHYQCCVYISEDFDVIHQGKKIDSLNTQIKVNKVWDDLIRNEFGSKERLKKMLKQEFGG